MLYDDHCAPETSTLSPGGRSIRPLTVESRRGSLLKVSRLASSYSSRFITKVAIFPCAGARSRRTRANAARSSTHRDLNAVPATGHLRSACTTEPHIRVAVCFAEYWQCAVAPGHKVLAHDTAGA
jgi:hypothetical protein